MMNKSQNSCWKALGAKTSVVILITAALLVMMLSAVQSYFAHQQIRANLEQYNFPVHDQNNCVIAILGVDLNAEWLGYVLNSHDQYLSTYNLLLSGKGSLICGPDAAEVKHQKVKEMVGMVNDTTLEHSLSQCAVSDSAGRALRGIMSIRGWWLSEDLDISKKQNRIVLLS